MKKLTLLFCITFISITSSFSQGTVRGKISDKNGETLIGVTIALKSNPSIGTVTDFDGNFSLKMKDSLAQVITISYVSYQTIEQEIRVLNNQVIVKDFVMEEASAKALDVVEISTKATKDKSYYMERIKQNSSTTIDYISSETMKKTGDANVVAAVARVAGVSTNGGFITVRGIGDRYVKTTVNGNRIPTLDPFTNNIKLDMFPASLVDNVIITKTASPDMPGDYAGAYISVETKDYPDALTVSIESTVGYNAQTTGKDVITSERSKTDWLGYDNTYREYNHTQFHSTNPDPTQYQEMVALGLGDYYKSLGVTGWAEGSNEGLLYFKLGLVQLGLLAPALINDNTAVIAATSAFDNGSYHSTAFDIVNKDAAATGKSFPNNWNTTKRKAPLSFSQSFTVGDQVSLFGKPLGFVAGFRYGSATLYDPHAILEEQKSGTRIVDSHLDAEASDETNGWSALVNLAYKVNPNNTVGFMFMPNLIGVNKVRKGYDEENTLTTVSQFYEARKQMIYQFKSEHYIPNIKTKVELNASYTKGNSNAPDFKYLQYESNPVTHIYSLDPSSKSIDRYYRYLSDNLFDSHGSIEIPIGEKPGLTRKLKLGGAYQEDKTKNDLYHYFLGKDGLNAPHMENDDLNAYLNLDQFGISHGDNGGVPFSTLNWYYNLFQSPTDHSFGHSKIAAAFLMADFTIIPRIRVSGGLRIETTDMLTDVTKFDSMGLANDDPRRFYLAGELPATIGSIKQTNILPSATIVYKLINKEESPTNIRLGYSQTLARPSLREISNITTFDNELRLNVTGNPNLKMVEVKNYDFRIESYFKNKDNVSISVFYKDFKNHIELIRGERYTWTNVDIANVKGIEIEGRKKIVKGLDFTANITLAQSYTEYVRTRNEVVGTSVITYNLDTVKRTMFGQAPYVINGILSYTSDSLGLTATVSYNLQGKRVVIGSASEFLGDTYEMPRHQLDFKVTKKFKKVAKNWSVSFTIKDILNQPVTRKIYYDGGYDIIKDQYRWGTNYLLSITYKL